MLRKQTVVRGFQAGLIGATILAVWFLIMDTIQGQPFYTPAFLSDIIVNVDVDRSVLLIALYTVFHYAAFCIVGVAMAWLLSGLERFPTILLGLVLGFLLFDLVFYSGIVLNGADIVEELGWPQVLSGNLLAGIGVTSYLRLKSEAPSLGWLPALAKKPIVREGLMVGVIAAAAVAVWFLLFDMVRGQIFFTPGALGSALFLRVSGPSQVEVTFLTVGGYTVVHFAAFIIVALAAAAIACQAEETPPLLLAGVLIFATFEAFFLGLLAIAAEWLFGALGWLSIGVGNLIATVVMAYLIWREHPKLHAALGKQTLAEEDIELP